MQKQKQKQIGLSWKGCTHCTRTAGSRFSTDATASKQKAASSRGRSLYALRRGMEWACSLCPLTGMTLIDIRKELGCSPK